VTLRIASPSIRVYDSRMRRILVAALATLVALAVSGCAPATVSKNQVVQIAYKGTLPDGTLFAQSPEGKPLEFLVGAGILIPALEKGLLGMKTGETRTVTVKAADAYGEWDPKALKELPRGEFPKDVELKVGSRYQFTTSNGPIVVTVAALTPTTVTIDFNHPLAGKDLTFEVTVVKIRPATKEELAKSASEAGAKP
jgi:FKBP-type peptidyl-prolyl cis-trans isomerase 2